MKQVGIRLEEELIKQAKQRALDEDTSFQEIVAKALEKYLAPEVKTKEFGGILFPESYNIKLTPSAAASLEKMGELVYMMSGQLRSQRKRVSE